MSQAQTLSVKSASVLSLKLEEIKSSPSMPSHLIDPVLIFLNDLIDSAEMVNSVIFTNEIKITIPEGIYLDIVRILKRHKQFCDMVNKTI